MARFGNCPLAGGWLRWNPHPLDEAPAGSQGQRNHRNVTGVLRHHRRRIAALDEKLSRDIAALGERIARLEGFMEGVRDAIAGKAA